MKSLILPLRHTLGGSTKLTEAGDTDVAIAFFCQVEDIVFFENFSDNSQLKEYSPGLLMYVKFMEELIRRRCRYMYLGGRLRIQKKIFFEHMSIRKVVFYGYGVCGHAFFQLSKNLDMEVLYGIDRNNEGQTEISLYSPDDEFLEADAVLITLNSDNKEVEKLLNKRFGNVFYWNDVLNQIISDYRRRIDESN